MNIKIKYGIFSFFIILIQSFIKILGLILTGSLSLLSESVDTFTDIFFVSLTIFSIYISQKPPDHEHMYGHSKVDSIGAIVQGIMLINIYIYLIINAIQRLLSLDFTVKQPGIGLILLIISFSINIIFSRILIWKGKQKDSLSLRMQGLNLFQDSLRAIIVIINFLIVIFLSTYIFDPIFSMAISIFIIISAIKLIKVGVENLIDVNPISKLIINDLRNKILNLEHVNDVNNIKIRASGKNLFLEIQLAVEDHISIIHANEILTAIRSLSNELFPHYKVETIVEMNPLSSEPSISESLINILHTMKSEFPSIYDFQDIYIFRLKEKYSLSLTILVDYNLTLKEAHATCSDFENQIKQQVPSISRIITHIEPREPPNKISSALETCERVDSKVLEQITKNIQDVLNKFPHIKGFHDLECWRFMDGHILELSVLFNPDINIAEAHHIISMLEKDIKLEVSLENLKDVIIHPEPLMD